MVIVVIIGIIVITDYSWQKFTSKRKLRLAEPKVKEGFDRPEGGLHIKDTLHYIQKNVIKQDLAIVVPKATVIITDLNHHAVALYYEMKNTEVPMLIAKGQDNLALFIQEIAKQHNIPFIENPPLARALYDNVDIDQKIPLKYYKIIAKIIRFVLGYDHSPPSTLR